MSEQPRNGRLPSRLNIEGSLRLSQISQLIGSLGYAGALWLLAVLLIHRAGIEEYGRYAAVLAISAPVFMCANARGRLLVSSSSNLPAPISSYVVYRMMTSVVAGLLCLALAVWGMGNTASIVVAVILFKGIEAVSDIFYAIFQRHGRAEIVGISQGLKATLFLALLSLGWFYELDSAVAFVVLLAAGLAIMLAFDGYFVNRYQSETRPGPLPVDLRSLASVFSHLRPMMVIALLASLFSTLPRVFLDYFHGYSDVGQYSALMLFSSAALVVASALGQPYLRGIGVAYSSGDSTALQRYLIQMALIAVLIAAIFALLLGFWGRTIFPFILDSPKSVPSRIVLLLVIVIFLNCLCLMQWYVMAAIGIRRAQVWLAAGSLVSMISICLIIIPTWVVTGALISDVLALMTQALFAAMIIAHVLLRVHRGRAQT